jgi:membrane fusion protein, multidrug efflux system
VNNQQEETEQIPVRNGKRKFVIIGVILIIAIGGFVYWLMGRGKVSTDDAQVQGHIVPISPRVAGYVAAIDVDDNDQVRAGQLLVRLDQRDLDSALRKAEADLASQRAQAVAAGTQAVVTARVAPSTEQQAGAGVEVANSQIAAAIKQIEVAQSQAKSADAGVQVARDTVASAKDDVDAAAAQVSAAEAGLQQAQSDVTAAEARAKQSTSDLARFKSMFEAGAASRQAYESADALNTANQAALAAARDRVASAKAVIAQAKAHKSSVLSQVAQAKSRLVAAVQTAAQSQAGIAVARTGLAQAQARLQQAQAAYSGSLTAPQQIAISQDQRRSATAKAAQAAATLSSAKLQLSYTQINSPVTGIVSQKTIQLGQYVQPGQMLLAVVPLNGVWVVANFKETQVGRMKVGQKATISVDAYPQHDIRGRIQSIGAATGAKFSLLPAENATGNFVKVVQRIPVKIVLDRPFPKGAVLRLGMNVIATVDLNSGRG